MGKTCGVVCCDAEFATAAEAEQHERNHEAWLGEKFPVWCLTRESIVDDINSVLDVDGTDKQFITADDPRLTSERCQAFASGVSTVEVESWDMSADERADAMDKYLLSVAEEFGLIPTEVA